MSYNWKCCSFYPNNFDASALQTLYLSANAGRETTESGTWDVRIWDERRSNLGRGTFESGTWDVRIWDVGRQPI